MIPANRLAPAVLCLWLTLGSLATLHGQDEGWTVDAVLKQASITDVAIAPDGRRILWTQRSPDFDKDRFVTDIYLTLLDDPYGAEGPATLQLTRTQNNSNPAWSPNGHWIAFASSRPLPDGTSADGTRAKGRQIWLSDPRGGEPYPLTTLENGFQQFAWLNDDTLVFSAEEDPSYYVNHLEETKDDAVVVEDTTLFAPVRLFSVDVKTKKIERLTDNRLQIGEFSPSPDGRHIVYSLDRSPVTEADARVQPLQFLLDLDAGTTTEIFTGDYFDPGNFLWTLDGSGFYSSDEVSSDPEHEGAGITELYYFDIARKAHETVLLDWDWGVGFGGYAVTKTGVHVQLADGVRLHPRHYTRTPDGWTYTDVPDERLPYSTSLTLGPDGETLVFATSRADQAPAYLYGTYAGGTVTAIDTLTTINAYLDRLPDFRAEAVEWIGAEEDSVTGLLYYPQNYEEGTRYPLIVTLHGGPSGADLDAWSMNWTVYPGIWTQKDAFVLRVNYHGSGHHGMAFVESIKGRYYELELPDILKGIDYLDARGLIDRDRMGVQGWSAGAILTTALTVEHPDLFKAAAPGAGDVNWITDYTNCSFGVRFGDSYFNGPFWENPAFFIEKSPVFRLHQVVTPTILFHGDKDRAVPTQQSWEHYRVLQQVGKAPVRLVLFPGQPHGLQRLSHQKRKMEEEIAWFDYYLFGDRTFEDDVQQRALPEAAPLALMDRTKDVAKTDGLYGESVDGVLIPEVVAVNDTLQAGRFEVTRAQFKAFRPSYDVPSGTGNYPANNLSLDDARAFVDWLNRTTGGRYRLPTKAEAEALAQLAGASENNLAHWAGYAPTPDERAVLQERIAALTPDDLLMPVGSRPPGNVTSSRPLIFDTNGNVAEWTFTPDGAGTPATASAVTLADPKAADEAEPPPAFTGLRVARD